jgi:CHAT domain-containing protein/Tfp pilus assembly protein PilF
VRFRHEWGLIRKALAACVLMIALSAFSTAAIAGLSEECSALFERGNQYYRHGDYARATESLERAARIAENAFGSNSPNVGLVYNSLSTAYMAQGRFADAEPFLKRAIQIRERNVGPNSPDLVPVLTNLGQVYDNQTRYEEAEALYKRVLAIQQASVGADHPSVAISLGNLANLYQHQGRYGEAEASYQRALSIFEKAFGPDHPNLTFVLDNFAALYGNEERHDDAIKLMLRSLAIKEKAAGADSPVVGVILTNIAMLYDRDGRFADAEALYKRVLAISEKVGKDSVNVGASLNNLAAFYRARNRLAEAEPLYQRALKIQQKAYGPNHPEIALVQSNLAVLYDKQGRYAEAEPLFQRSLTIDQNTAGPDSSAIASDTYALALLYAHMGRAAEAEPLFNRALALRQKSSVFNPADVAISLGGLAGFYDGQGRSADALAAARKAVAIWSLNGATAWDPNAAGNSGYERNMRDFLPELIRLLFQNYSSAGTSPPEILDEAFRASQSARGLDTAQALAGMTARYAAGSDALATIIRDQQDLSSRSQALSASLIKVLSQPVNQRGPNAEATIRAEQSKVETRLKADNDRLRSEFPRFVELARAQPVGVADLQHALGADEAFAAFTLGDRDSYLFVISKGKAAFFKLDMTRAQAAQSVQELRAALVDDKPFPVAKAHELYARLFGPADDLIAGAKSLIVVPDGALQSLPLSVLVTAQMSGNDADYKHVAWLIRRQALTIVPAASSFVSLRGFPVARRPANPFVGFGDPDFKGTAAKRGVDTISLYKGSEAVADRLRALPRLADTADELRAEAKLLGAPDTSVHLGENASVTTVKSLDLSNTRIVAFATHAGVAGELAQVMEPALALTPPARPTPEDDGLLRASQISQLRLNADFVILSACNTAAPDGTPGAEGLSGLAKAFFYAGARSLLVSHWEVQSDPTVKLTTGLIAAITADPSIGRAEALRRSMLAMIDHSQNADDAHPIAWAPFVLAGEGGANR